MPPPRPAPPAAVTRCSLVGICAPQQKTSQRRATLEEDHLATARVWADSLNQCRQWLTSEECKSACVVCVTQLRLNSHQTTGSATNLTSVPTQSPQLWEALPECHRVGFFFLRLAGDLCKVLTIYLAEYIKRIMTSDSLPAFQLLKRIFKAT